MKKASLFIGNNVRLEFLDELNRKHAEDFNNVLTKNSSLPTKSQVFKKKSDFIHRGSIFANSMFEYPSLNSDEIIK